MAKVLIVTGSVRPNSVNGKIVELVRSAVEAQSGAEAQVADLGEINLPFYNGATPPSVDDFEAGNEAARNWSELVKAADAVVLVSPEYNHGLSGIQKNLWCVWLLAGMPASTAWLSFRRLARLSNGRRSKVLLA